MRSPGRPSARTRGRPPPSTTQSFASGSWAPHAEVVGAAVSTAARGAGVRLVEHPTLRLPRDPRRRPNAPTTNRGRRALGATAGRIARPGGDSRGVASPDLYAVVAFEGGGLAHRRRRSGRRLVVAEAAGFDVGIGQQGLGPRHRDARTPSAGRARPTRAEPDPGDPIVRRHAPRASPRRTPRRSGRGGGRARRPGCAVGAGRVEDRRGSGSASADIGGVGAGAPRGARRPGHRRDRQGAGRQPAARTDRSPGAGQGVDERLQIPDAAHADRHAALANSTPRHASLFAPDRRARDRGRVHAPAGRPTGSRNAVTHRAN